MKSKFAELVYQLRKDASMTQVELADLLGITDKAVSRWENGETFPETSQLVPLASILSVSVDELLKGQRENADKVGTNSEAAIEVLNNKRAIMDRNIDKTTKILSIIAIVCSALHLILYFGIILFQQELIYASTGLRNDENFIFPWKGAIYNIGFTAVLVVFSSLTIKQSKTVRNKILTDVISLVVVIVLNSAYTRNIFGVFDLSTIELSAQVVATISILQRFFSLIVGIFNLSFLAFFATNIIKIVYKKVR